MRQAKEHQQGYKPSSIQLAQVKAELSMLLKGTTTEQ